MSVSLAIHGLNLKKDWSSESLDLPSQRLQTFFYWLFCLCATIWVFIPLFKPPSWDLIAIAWILWARESSFMKFCSPTASPSTSWIYLHQVKLWWICLQSLTYQHLRCISPNVFKFVEEVSSRVWSPGESKYGGIIVFTLKLSFPELFTVHRDPKLIN